MYVQHGIKNDEKFWVAPLILGEKNTGRLRADSVEEPSYSFC